MKILSLFLLWLTCLNQGEAEKTFYQAFYLESALRQMETAAETYGHAAEQALKAHDNGLHVRALLGQARCRKALGQLEASRELFTRALEIDPQNPEARSALEEQADGDGLDPELALRIQAMVQELGGPGRVNAASDLSRIGGLAVPYLERGLRSRDVAVVEGAAGLLSKLGSAEAAEALRAGLTDSEVLFPALLVTELGDVPWNSATRLFFETALAHESVKVRRSAIYYVSRKSGALPPEVVLPAVRRGLADPDTYVRSTALRASVKWEFLVDELRPFFQSTLREERLQAIQISRLSGLTERLAAELRQAFRDGDAEVRSAAAGAFSGDDSGALDGALLIEVGLSLLGHEDLELVFSGARILSKISTPWPVQVQAAAEAELQRLLAGTSRCQAKGSIIRGVMNCLIRAEGGPGLPDDDLLRIYAQAGHPSTQLADENRQKLRESILNRMGVVLGQDPALLGVFLKAALQSSVDELGQQLVLERAPRLIKNLFRSPIQPGPLSLLLVAAGSEFPPVRLLAYDHLTEDLDAAQVAALPHLLTDLGSEDRKLASEAFKVIESHPRPEAAEAALKFFHRMIESGDENASALRLYVQCAGRTATPLLRDLLRAGGGRHGAHLIGHLARLEGEQAVPDLLAFVTKTRGPDFVAKALGDSNVLAHFVLALSTEQVSADLLIAVESRIPESALEQLLLTALDSTDSVTQAEACRLSGLAAFESTLPKLIALLESNTFMVRNRADQAVLTIQQRKYNRLTADLLGPAGKSAALERALGLIKDDDPVQRQGGALALGALGDAADDPALLDLLEDRDATVRQSAIQALENLGRRPQGDRR